MNMLLFFNDLDFEHLDINWFSVSCDLAIIAVPDD